MRKIIEALKFVKSKRKRRIKRTYQQIYNVVSNESKRYLNEWINQLSIINIDLISIFLKNKISCQGEFQIN